MVRPPRVDTELCPMLLAVPRIALVTACILRPGSWPCLPVLSLQVVAPQSSGAEPVGPAHSAAHGDL